MGKISLDSPRIYSHTGGARSRGAWPPPDIRRTKRCEDLMGIRSSLRQLVRKGKGVRGRERCKSRALSEADFGEREELSRSEGCLRRREVEGVREAVAAVLK